MKRLIMGFVLAAAFVASAEQYAVSSAEGMKDVTFGSDKINYSGTGSQAYDGAVGFTTASGEATTFDIQGGASLELSGALSPSAVAGSLVKTGLGSLILSNYGDIAFAGSNGSIYGGFVTSWDEAGKASNFSQIEVIQGTLELAGDKTVRGSNIYCGNGSDGSLAATLKVTKGKLEATNILGLNLGKWTSHDITDTLYVGADATVSTKTIWGNRGRVNNIPVKSRILVDGGTFYNMLKTPEVGAGSFDYDIQNGGLFSYENDLIGLHWIADGVDHFTQSLLLGTYDPAFAATVRMNVSGASTVKANAFASYKGQGQLNVSGDSVVRIDRTREDLVLRQAEQGTVSFDGATLMPNNDRYWADWFTFNSGLAIGPGGLTVNCLETGTLDGKPTGSGTVVKTGAGTLAMQAGAVDVDVREGAVAFVVANDGSKADRTGTIAAAAGTKVIVAGENALGSMELVAGDQANVFRLTDRTIGEQIATYNFVQAACPRKDGWMRLNEPLLSGTNAVGAVWQKEKMDLTRSFAVTFDYACTKTQGDKPGSYYAYGFAVGWQNEGATVHGGRTSGATGRGQGWGCPFVHSFAVSQDTAGSNLRYTRDGQFLTGDDDADIKHFSARGTFADPAHGRIVYDVEKHQVQFTMTGPNGDFRKMYVSVDLAETCGDSSAWFGFTGSAPSGNDQNGRGGHFVSNVRISYETPEVAAVADVGGRVSVADGKVFSATLEPGDVPAVWSVDALTCSGAATVAVAGGADATLGAKTVSGSGTLTKTGTANLALGMPQNDTLGFDVKEGGLSIAYGPSEPYADDLRPTEANWNLVEPIASKRDGCESCYGGVTATGVRVGRACNAVNGSDNYIGMINSTKRFKVNTSFKLTYDLSIDICNIGADYGFFSFCFHNDARGADAVGVAVTPNKQQPFCGCVNGVGNCAAIVWGGEENEASYPGYGRKVMMATGDGTIQANSAEWHSTSPVQTWFTGAGNITYATNCTVTIEYDLAAKALTLTMTQPNGDGSARTFTKTFSGVDLPAAVGGDLAYIGFGSNSCQSWYGLRQTVSNLRYEDLAPLAAGTVTVDAGLTFAVKNPAAGVCAKIARGLNLGAGATLAIEGEATAGALTADGVLTIDGGTYRIDNPAAFAGVERLYLTNGAKLAIPSGVALAIRRLYVDGQRMRAGYYDSTAGFVTGGGRVEIGSIGLKMLIR